MNTQANNRPDTQSSQLLPSLFPGIEEEVRLNVLHLGPAFQDTVEFLSGYRCRLWVVDLFAELPPPAEEDTDSGLQGWFSEVLQIPAGQTFDVCLFWDLFNYLEAPALEALLQVILPHLAPGARGHGFSVHNPRTPQSGYLYGIRQGAQVSMRERPAPLPGYAPHSQNRLKDLLRGFNVERSVLLADRRLELLLRAPAAEGTARA